MQYKQYFLSAPCSYGTAEIGLSEY